MEIEAGGVYLLDEENDGVLTIAAQREFSELVVEGLSNPGIAERLFVTRSTAKAHVSNILSKLGVSNRGEAIAFALQHKLVT